MTHDSHSQHGIYWRAKLLVLMALPVLTFLTLAVRTGGASVAAPGGDGTTPCLDGDPHNLEDLRLILDNPNPPRGVQRINPSMTVEFVGQGMLAEGAPAYPSLAVDDPASDGADEPPAGEADYREVQLQVFNALTENVFHLIAQQAMLDDILQCHENAGLTRATEGVDDEAPEDRLLWLPAITSAEASPAPPAVAEAPAPAIEAPEGWSNGVDTRLLRTATTSWPWRTISQFRYGNVDESRCTGTLIGPRHLVTAAHCINQQGTNTWYTIRVAPGKNGVGNEPYGESVISINPAPGTSAWYFTPWQWRDPNLTHWQWDWGLIVIPDRLGDQTGWMGYVALSGNYLKTVANYNRGYPLCGTSNDPANCQDARLYGDMYHCNIGNFYNPGPDNWNRRIAVSCDMSGGHSGSAVYNYFYDANLGQYVPVVAMVASTQTCTTCDADDDYPNVMRRITPGDLGTISWLRETFP